MGYALSRRDTQTVYSIHKAYLIGMDSYIRIMPQFDLGYLQLTSVWIYTAAEISLQLQNWV